MAKRYSIYSSTTLDRVLAERIKSDSEELGFRSRSSMISAIAERYSEIIRRSIRELSVPEWCLIFDVLNGCWMIDSSAIAAKGLAHQIADATQLDAAGSKWDVDGLSLARRVAGMTFAEQMAIIDAAERFWSLGSEEGEEYADIVRRLVGRTGDRIVVRHYTDEERPIIKGNGFDGLEIGETRDEAEDFVAWINARLGF